jgi:DNA-binding transcriptional regulator YbjK
VTVRGLGATHDERRWEILDAVFTVVDTEGAQQVTIRRVAAVAGVSVGRVQHYFPTKDALLTGAFTAVNELGTERVRQRIPENGVEGEGPASILDAVLTELIPETADDCRLVRVAQTFETYACTRSELKDRVVRGYDELVSLLAQLIGGCLATDSGKQEDAARFRSRAYELLGLATGLAALVVVDALAPRAARDILTHRLTELLDASPEADG